MKKYSIIAGLLSFGGMVALSAMPVFADSALCPTGQFNVLCMNVPSPEGAVALVINVLLFVAFVAALVFLIIGGVRWILSGGDKEATGKAKGTVTSALIGLAVVLAAWILLNVITNFFGLGNVQNLQLPSLKGIGASPTMNSPRGY